MEKHGEMNPSDETDTSGGIAACRAMLPSRIGKTKRGTASSRTPWARQREREIVRVRSVTTMNERASSLVLTGHGVGVSGGGAAA